MSKAAKGFSLVECLIYCAITSFLSIMAFNFFTRTMAGAAQFSSHQRQMVTSASIEQLLRADIQMASTNANDWHTGHDFFVCKHGQLSVGWRMSNKNLYRIQGQYDFEAHAWIKKSTALVAQKINNFECSVHGNRSTLAAVSYIISFENTKLHNKILLWGNLA